jgi:hypothetical protein
LAEDDKTEYEGIPVVTPARAIREAHDLGLGPALVGQAIDDGERRGVFSAATAERLRAETGTVAAA